MRLNKFLFPICILISSLVYSQNADEDYYIFPIKPGQKNYLAGTMGELRSSHFHAGIDIKTGGVVGWNVYAAAAGYISRIKVSSYGYGNTLYLQHENKTTTVYAHLLEFDSKIAQYVREAQYKEKSFNIELFPGKEEFVFKKGDVIATSGNSGSSGGPHLHFEIRDANQKVLNPLHYHFEEIEDELAPIVAKMAIRTMDINGRINQEYGRQEFNLTRVGNKYMIPEPIKASGNIGIELLTHDKLNGASNRNGVPTIDLFVNGEKVFRQDITQFAFSETHNIMVFVDYEKMVNTGKKYNKLYVDNGNTLSFYETNNSNGIVNIKPGKSYSVKAILKDAYNNIRELTFMIEGEAPTIKNLKKASKNSDKYLIDNHTLILYTQMKDVSPHYANFHVGHTEYELAPSYTMNDQAIYLWDLRNGIPDSSQICGDKTCFDIDASIPNGNKFSYYGKRIDITFPKDALYETYYLRTNYTANDNKEYFSFGDFNTPLRKYLTVTLEPKNEYQEKNKTFVYSVKGSRYFNFIGGTWEGNKITFKTRDFGKYTLIKDTIPPTIRPLKINKEVISFIIKDELSGIKDFNAFVEGEWLLMNFDHKKNLIWSEKLNNNTPFKGTIYLRVNDNADNQQTYTKILE